VTIPPIRAAVGRLRLIDRQGWFFTNETPAWWPTIAIARKIDAPRGDVSRLRKRGS